MKRNLLQRNETFFKKTCPGEDQQEIVLNGLVSPLGNTCFLNENVSQGLSHMQHIISYHLLTLSQLIKDGKRVESQEMMIGTVRLLIQR